MALLSTLKVLTQNQAFRQAQKASVRFSGHGHQIRIQPSRHNWKIFKDNLHFYLLLGIIPLTLATLYANIFVGQAELSEIPEGYTPHHWEYYKHPVTRFIAKYTPNPVIYHETLVSKLNEESETIIMKKLEKQLKFRMSREGDYQSWYYLPVRKEYNLYQQEFVNRAPIQMEGVTDSGDLD